MSSLSLYWCLRKASMYRFMYLLNTYWSMKIENEIANVNCIKYFSLECVSFTVNVIIIEVKIQRLNEEHWFLHWTYTFLKRYFNFFKSLHNKGGKFQCVSVFTHHLILLVIIVGNFDIWSPRNIGIYVQAPVPSTR